LLDVSDLLHSDYFVSAGDEVPEKCTLLFETWVEKT
jgi:hypothetical protein